MAYNVYPDFSGTYSHNHSNYEYIRVHRLNRTHYTVEYEHVDDIWANSTTYEDYELHRIINVEKNWALRYPISMNYPEGI